jgi:hypothetical protein
MTTIDLNHLRRGAVYLAHTDSVSTEGEYLGIETAHGDRAILLRHSAGTASLAVTALTAITLAEAL